MKNQTDIQAAARTPLIMTPEASMITEDYGIEILRDGTWLYGGTPITRHNLVKLFASVLKRDDLGDFWLQTPYEKGRIAVQDAPFVAVGMNVMGSGKDQVLHFETNIDETVAAGADHPLRVVTDSDGTPAPYVHVRGGLDATALEALIARAVYYDLVNLAVPDPQKSDVLGVWSGGVFFPLGHQAGGA